MVKYKDKEYNLCTFFIAPLCFDSGAILNSIDNVYLHKTDYKIYVVFNESIEEKSSVSYWNNEGKLVSLYNIPEKYYSDFTLFKDSKYSKMSDDCKKIICKYSGLPVNKEINGKMVTHKLITQLLKTKSAIKEFEDSFDVKYNDNELISKLDSNEYYG